MVDLKFEFPTGRFKDKLCGIYRMDFSNGNFYIGSSSHLRQRANNWRKIINAALNGRLKGEYKISESMLMSAKESFEVVFNIIRICSLSELKNIEEQIMVGYRGNLNMINKILHPANGVIVKNKEGVEVARYKSLTEAAKEMKLYTRRIQDVCDGRRKTTLGLHFEYENKDLRLPIVKKIKKEKPITVLKFTVDGQFVKGYLTTAEAARDCKINKKGIYSVIVGKQRTAAGFVFKRA